MDQAWNIAKSTGIFAITNFVFEQARPFVAGTSYGLAEGLLEGLHDVTKFSLYASSLISTIDFGSFGSALQQPIAR